jgi:TonB family protein
MTLRRLRNAPEDMLDFYRSEQLKNPSYRYMAHVQIIFDDQLSEFNLEKATESFSRRGMLRHDVDYARLLTSEEFEKYFFEAKRHGMSANITSAYGIIWKVDRLKAAEHKYKTSSDDDIHDDYDKKAVYSGGDRTFENYLKKHLHYPEAAKKQGIEDEVVLRFVVGKQGGLINLNIIQFPATRDDELSLEFEKAAFFAVNATSGDWQPAEKDGKYVNSIVTLPIKFKLEE